jgi:hypothetical protein
LVIEYAAGGRDEKGIHPMTDLIDICTREFALAVKRRVEREFEALKDLPGDSVEAEVPIIGGQFNPHDPEEVSFWQQRAIRALIAQRWWEKEVPKWAQPMPLRAEEFTRLRNEPRANDHDFRRARLIADYADEVRGKGYRLENVRPFEIFCAQTLSPR